MSIWSRISEALKALAKGESLSHVFEKLRTPPERSVAFTIAVVALGAKMAKADGRVTRNEVSAFREVFQIAPGDEAGAARVFNLARQDVAGFEEYAERIAGMFGPDAEVLEDLMEGLFHIALADGDYHDAEDAFLTRVAEIFRIDPAHFQRMRARFVPQARCDAYTILGLTPGATMQEARSAWRQAVRESHPDTMMARGLPPEAIKLAERRMADINRAWEEIQSAHV
ncbi:molecular chaperone DjiA [Pseudooceanicola sp. CBS1P-1]|uniref:Molecular chaperone DjiA n=1 Tax=Pseudooceanicola albus TaxID=2692189 RepID=A0A6L7G6J7_9RHOB|nr:MULTISPECIES: molecular chaperone DjiA [Pseudooceanicola]MBT9384592.1 molecular chaperone DjiA [Pseudooceanicola endophyticus]MXN18293.1 molecular chaperone DjiA [Pseudooceanicola albus]